MTRSGRTWGEVNAPPIVPASDRRGGYTVLSAITPEGELFSRILDTPMESDQYIEFLRGLLDQYPNLVIVLADHASFHRSHKVRDFVRAHRQRLRRSRSSPHHAITGIGGRGGASRPWRPAAMA